MSNYEIIVACRSAIVIKAIEGKCHEFFAELVLGTCTFGVKVDTTYADD